MSNVYVGTFSDKDWYQVTVNGEPLDPKPSQRLHNHSPDGFAWGYTGSGPAQLALAILLKETGDRGYALERYFDFRNQVIARLRHESDFTLTSEEVADWVKANQ